MPERKLLTKYLAFRAMDARSTAGGKRQTAVVTYYDENGSRKEVKVTAYTNDPEGYQGPAVLECIRPPECPPPGSKESSTEPEPLHLYLAPTKKCPRKKAHVPEGKEGNQYLLGILEVKFLEMDMQEADPLAESLDFFVAIVDEDLDVINLTTRLEPIWKQASSQFLSLKVNSVDELLSEELEELTRLVEENRENIAANSNRLFDVENRVRTAEEQLAQLSDNFKRLLQLLLDQQLENGGTIDDSHLAPFLQALPMSPLSSRRPVRAARIQKLHVGDIDSIEFYTKTEGYEQINSPHRALASGEIDSLPPQVKTWTDKLDRALRKLPDFQGNVYRGVDMPAFWIQNIKQTFQENPRAKVPFSDPAFLSASTKIDRAFADKNCRFYIMSKTGKDIAAYSVHFNEFEVLFQRNTKFTIYKIVLNHHNNQLGVWMTED